MEWPQASSCWYLVSNYWMSHCTRALASPLGPAPMIHTSLAFVFTLAVNDSFTPSSSSCFPSAHIPLSISPINILTPGVQLLQKGVQSFESLQCTIQLCCSIGEKKKSIITEINRNNHTIFKPPFGSLCSQVALRWCEGNLRIGKWRKKKKKKNFWDKRKTFFGDKLFH